MNYSATKSYLSKILHQGQLSPKEAPIALEFIAKFTRHGSSAATIAKPLFVYAYTPNLSTTSRAFLKVEYDNGAFHDFDLSEASALFASDRGKAVMEQDLFRTKKAYRSLAMMNTQEFKGNVRGVRVTHQRPLIEVINAFESEQGESLALPHLKQHRFPSRLNSFYTIDALPMGNRYVFCQDTPQEKAFAKAFIDFHAQNAKLVLSPPHPIRTNAEVDGVEVERILSASQLKWMPSVLAVA